MVLHTLNVCERDRTHIKCSYHHKRDGDTPGNSEMSDISTTLWLWYLRCLHMSELIKVYTLNMLSSLYINDSSVKLLKLI